MKCSRGDGEDSGRRQEGFAWCIDVVDTVKYTGIMDLKHYRGVNFYADQVVTGGMREKGFSLPETRRRRVNLERSCLSLGKK